ncbi:glutamic acid-rich protein-like [Prunus persica]|uniref:glutamic acid-rich protein-like n=1 Tax=Prunus persica TaxID=3760 RepID=UPI0009AB9DE3|nr:glutamic acid-rich protein-like [Prunus persica]
MTVESTVQLNEIQNLKRRIAELEGKETRIDMEKIAKKKEIQGKYKAEIQSLLSDPTIFEMEMDLPTKQPTQPVEEKEEEEKEEEKQQEEREEEKKQDAPTPDVPSRVQRVKNRERKRLQASCYVYEKNKKTKKDDEELPQFKLISSEELTQEASQPDATNPIPDPPKGTSLHDSIPVDLQQSSDEDEGQKKPTKKKLGWGQRKVWQKIPKADRERIEKQHYLSTQLR